MRARELFEIVEPEPITKWMSWPGAGKELPAKFVTDALSNPRNPAHVVFTAVKNNPKTRMYRGMKIPRHDPNSILYLDPTTAPERKSKSLQNFYSLYMDHIGQEWNHFPKRNKSFICATSIGTTGIYGSTYVMVPARRTMVGACPEEDIWFSFSNMNLSTMVELFHNMFTAYHLGDPTTAQELVDHSETVAELMSRDSNRYQTVDTFSDYARSMLGQARFNPVTLMSYVLDPGQNNFKLIDWPNALPNKVEVWYSEPSYAIPIALFEKLIGPVG